MGLLRWSRKYSVGVTKLDDQHTAFIASLNKLHAAMIRGQGKAITGPLLQALVAYAREHTSAEEELMSSTNYPGLEQHRAEHRKLVAKFEELKTAHEQGEASVCIALLRFMRGWISEHIQEHDQAYTPWLTGHGVR
jgi:hemerythrin-like metal-binding protein